MATSYPTGGAITLPLPFLSPPEVRLSEQERNRLAVARHIDKDPVAYRARRREHERARLAADPMFRACKSQRNVLNLAVNRIKSGLPTGYRPALGYRTDALKAHLESQFLPGMTWDNHGDVWTVDHIRPVSEFIKAGETRSAVISALDNLRPMWKFDNASKHKREAPSVPVYRKKRDEYFGENHHLHKLTVPEVREIKRRLREGTFGIMAQLAREYGVATNTIHQIKSGKTWKHVD